MAGIATRRTIPASRHFARALVSSPVLRYQRAMAREAAGGEWLGGWFSAPVYVMEGGPERPDVILWMDATSGLIVGMRLDRPPLGPDDVAACLEHAIEKPSADVPRPSAVRVPDAATAAAVRARFGDAMVVRVAPVPELEAAVIEMGKSLSGEGGQERTYLQSGRVPAESVAWMFRAAAALWRVAPWRFASDGQIVVVDVPDLDVRGACLSIIGALGENFGFVLFDSLAGYERFIGGAGGGAPDVSGMVLSLGYERRVRLPAAMRREIAEHRWPVAGARAHPVVMCMDADGVSRPTMDRDMRLAAACAEALAELTVRHRAAFEAEAPTSVRTELRVPLTAPSVTVRLAYPHPVLCDGGTPAEAPVLLTKVRRNDPCPCGSGRKYKRCHLAEDEAARGSPAARAAELIAMDQRLIGDVQRFMRGKLAGPLGSIVDAWERGSDEVPREEQLLVPWIVFYKRFEGRPALTLYLERRGAHLSAAERAWLEAQRGTPLSVWQAVSVVPDSHLVMADLLTGRRHMVYDRNASRSARVRDVVLARVVDHQGMGVLCGMHPMPLPPSAADKVVRHVKRLLHTRAARVPAERLSEEAVVLALAAAWEGAIEAEEQGFRRLRFTNTDGDPLLVTVDHFAFEPAARAAVEARLGTLGERHGTATGADTVVFDVMRVASGRASGLERVLAGRLEVGDGTLRVETNSAARANGLRREVEAACGDLVRHRAREHADPRAAIRRGDQPRSRPEPIDTPEAAQLVLAFKREHYVTWLDEKIPALGDLTPREATRRPASRRRLELLLQDMERLEAGLPVAQRFDFGWVRGELGLHPPDSTR